MNEEFKLAYGKLDLNNKRNEFSNELLAIAELLKSIEMILGMNSEDVDIDIKNYDLTKDKKLNENEILSFFYEDIYAIRKEVTTILYLISNRQQSK